MLSLFVFRSAPSDQMLFPSLSRVPLSLSLSFSPSLSSGRRFLIIEEGTRKRSNPIRFDRFDMDVGVPIRCPNPDSSSAHRFVGGGFSTQNPSPSSSSAADEDLSEDDIFSAVDFSETAHRQQYRGNNLSGLVPPAAASSPRLRDHHLGRQRSSGFGILAALPERDNNSVFGRKASVSPSSPLSAAAPISSSRMIPTIPRPPQDRFPTSFSLVEKCHQSAPVNVPVLMARRRLEFVEVEDEIGDGDDDKDFDGEEMLPPHEIVARRLSRSQSVACSVLDGAGRTLKGRDLRQVRNAVWRQTGFLD